MKKLIEIEKKNSSTLLELNETEQKIKQEEREVER